MTPQTPTDPHSPAATITFREYAAVHIFSAFASIKDDGRATLEGTAEYAVICADVLARALTVRRSGQDGLRPSPRG